MARPTTRATDDQVGGRRFFNTASATYLAYTTSGTAQSPYFFQTQGATQMTFGVCRPTRAGTWIPYIVDDQGNLFALTSARTINAGTDDFVTCQINGDMFAIVFTEGGAGSGTLQSFYMAEGGAAG